MAESGGALYFKTPPPQTQDTQPGEEHQMDPQPIVIRPDYKGSDKLKNKVAIITGGDSGIGRAVAVHFAREGADVVISYLSEGKDAEDTKQMVEKEGHRCLARSGDVGDPQHARELVDLAVKEFGRLDIVVNNAGEQHEHKDIREITPEALERTFRTNIFAHFFLTQAALDHLKEGSSIINTTSVTSYHGSASLVDYSSTKGAIVAFTRSLSKQLVGKGIRVNGVAPGPIWTPLIPATFTEKKITEGWASKYPMGRPGHPAEVAPTYVFLASEDSSYYTGQVLHPNGGEIVNG